MKMRKWLFALAGLLVSAGAQAHVSAVPFPEVGSLQEAHKAAFARHATYLPQLTPQITCNMATGVASVGGPCTTPPAAGVCNGDMLTVTRTTSITSGTKNLTVTADTFVAGDVNKTILVPGASGGGGQLETTITSVGAWNGTTQTIVLAINAGTTLSSVSTIIQYGTDDATVFAQFNVWALANQGSNQVVQTLPNSGSCWFAIQQGGGAIKWVAGIKDLIVEGNNSTLDGRTVGWYAGDAAAGTGSSICHKGLTDASGCTARIKTVLAGSSTIELTAASFSAGYISRFSVNQWILLAGLNPQEITNANGSGYPPNPSFFEWRQITSICNNTGPCTGTATLTLNSALTYSYLSTWPNYSSGNSGEADGGGPATIYAMGANWNTRVEYKNMTMKTAGTPGGSGRFVTYRNVSFNGSIAQGAVNNCGPTPSQNETFAAYNVDWTYCTIETDKITSNVIFDTISSNRVDFQSSAIINLTLSNSTITTLNGTAQITTITDTSITNFRPGSYAYGNSNSLVCTRCNVTSFDGAGGILQNDSPTLYSMSGGVISFLNSDVTGAGPPNRIFAPMPANIFYTVGGSFSGSIGLFNAQAITQDPTNTFVQTNEAGGFPTFSGFAGALKTHPAQQYTCDACTGDPIFVATNIQLGATALKPLAEFSKRTYTPTVQANSIGDLLARGKIVSLTIDVTTASTSSGSPTLNVTGSAHQETVKQSNWTAYDWVPTINLKQAGTRVITPSGTTCNGVTGSGPGGSCAGDSCTLPASGCYSLPEAVWIKESLGPGVFGTFNGTNPTFTIEIKTNQGVVP